MDFANVKIDKSTPVPLYYQLKTAILSMIKNGDLKPGDMIPAELDLGDMYGLSRTTIRQAICELVNEGHLYRIKSKGTYVSKPKITQGFMQTVETFDEQMKKMGLTPRTELLKLEMILPSSEVAEALKVTMDTRIVHLLRRRYANDEAILYVDNYMIPECMPLIAAGLDEKGLYATLATDLHLRLVHFIRQIEATLATEYDSEMLSVCIGHPIQIASSVGYNSDGLPIEYAIVHYRGDKNKFIVEFNAKYN